ncbi:MAG TPA: toll/interleukin-1 receptor domain-containing protein [Polyangiaceae bacterium]|nr:toll/interleukin-1 receptor domain-containing protein [Polyangiaceae bacterium]
MAPLFISYAREDAPLARQIRLALRAEGLEVWWDENLQGAQRWAPALEEKLLNASAVVTLWSSLSVQSDWVKHEASVGKTRGVLVPVLVTSCTPPDAFAEIQAIDFVDWDGSERHAQFLDLLRCIRSATRRRRSRYLMRAAALSIGAVVMFTLGGFASRRSLGNQASPTSCPSQCVTPMPPVPPAASASRTASAESMKPLLPGCTPETPVGSTPLKGPVVVRIKGHGYGILTTKGYVLVPDYTIEYAAKEKTTLWIELPSEYGYSQREYPTVLGRTSRPVGLLCPLGVSLRAHNLDLVERSEMIAGASGELYRNRGDRTSGKILRLSVTSTVLGTQSGLDNTIEDLMEVTKVSKQGDAGAPFVDRSLRVFGMLYGGADSDDFVLLSSAMKAVPEAF